MATIKSYVKIFLNSGNNIESAEEMKNAILSSGGVPSVKVTVSGPPETSTFSTVRLEGVSTISNIEYSEEGSRVWKAYKIGPGKLIQWEKLDVQPKAEIPKLSAIDCDACGKNAQFKTVTSKKAKTSPKQGNTTGPCNSPSSDESSSDESNVGLFSLPEEGCVKRYQWFSSLRRHLECGRQLLAIENESLFN